MPRSESVADSFSHFFAAASVVNDRSRTPGMPATRQRLPLPWRAVSRFLPVSGSGFLVSHLSSIYPAIAAPVRHTWLMGSGLLSMISPAYIWNQRPPARNCSVTGFMATANSSVSNSGGM